MKTSYCHHFQPPKHRNLSKKHNGLYSISSKHHKQNTQAHIHKFEVLNILFVNDSIQIINHNLITLPNSQTIDEIGYRNYLRSSKMRETMITAAGRHVARRKLVGRTEQRKGSWEKWPDDVGKENSSRKYKKGWSFIFPCHRSLLARRKALKMLPRVLSLNRELEWGIREEEDEGRKEPTVGSESHDSRQAAAAVVI